MNQRRGASSRRASLPPLIGILLGVALFASGCSSGTSAEPSGSSSSATTSATSPTPTAGPSTTETTSSTPTVNPMGTLGPTGYGSLELGMSYADAVATGELEGTPQTGWTVKDHPKASVCVTKAGGLMAIFADKTAVTPEGIHVGSTLAQVKAAYPSLKQSIDYFYVPTSKTTRYFFLVSGKKVYEWNINTTDQTCFN